MDDEAYTPPPWPVRLFDATVYWIYHGGWKVIAALIVGAAIGASAVWLSGPRSFEDCIFRYAANAPSDYAANAARSACTRLLKAGAFSGNFFDRFHRDPWAGFEPVK